MTKRQFPFLSSEFDNDLDFPGMDDLPRPSKDVLALMMQDIMSRDEGKVAPDTAGADYFFLEEFITNEMELDFAVIEQDFMKHCGKRLQEFNEAGWYGEDERWKAEPEFAVKQKLLRLMYNGAKVGDAYCVELVKYLYKVYHKREYNQLKRFHKITVSEIFSLSEDKDGGNSFGAIGRILGMCQFLNIELDQRCSFLFLLLDKKRKDWIQENEEEREYKAFEEGLLDECIRQVDAWLDNDKKKDLKEFRKRNKIYLESQTFVEESLSHMVFPGDYMYMCMTSARGVRMQMANALAVLKTMDPEKEYSFEEVQQYAVLYGAVSALADVSDSYDLQVGYLLGDEVDIFDEENALFNPENIVVRQTALKRKEEPKVITNVAPVSMGTAAEDDYLKEIADLRRKVSEQEQKINGLREQCRQLKTSQGEKDKLLKKYQEDREELIALREYAYRSQLEEPPVTEETLFDMEKAIADKNIVIIGGHVNWLNKLKKRFPNWMYILTESYKTVDGKMLDGKDRVYFFTDHLSHVTYGKFIAAVRERHIPFGYLGSLNVEKLIRQIYEDTSGDAGMGKSKKSACSTSRAL